MNFSKKLIGIIIFSFIMTNSQIIKQRSKPIENNCIQKDTVSAMGTVIRYCRVNDSYKISYESDSFKRTIEDLFSCKVDEFGVWDEVPKFENETKNYFTLKNVFSTSSGRNPAPIDFSILIVPKHSFEKILVIDCFIKMKENYIINLDEENISKINILNLESKKVQKIILHSKPASFKGHTLFIKKADIIKNKIIISYETLNRKLEDIKLVTEEFKLDI